MGSGQDVRDGPEAEVPQRIIALVRPFFARITRAG